MSVLVRSRGHPWGASMPPRTRQVHDGAQTGGKASEIRGVVGGHGEAVAHADGAIVLSAAYFFIWVLVAPVLHDRRPGRVEGAGILHIETHLEHLAVIDEPVALDDMDRLRMRRAETVGPGLVIEAYRIDDQDRKSVV